MYQPDVLKRQIEALEHGRVRLDVIYGAIRQADKAGDIENRFEFREMLLHESVFYNDSLDLFIVFPEFMALYEKYPELNQNLFHTHNMLWDFKWLLGNVGEFYQISVAEREKYYAKYKELLEKNGHSLRPYYDLRYDVYLSADDNMEQSKKYFKLYRESPRDSQCNCRACEMSSELNFLFMAGEVKEAMAILRRLETGKYTCKEQPAVAYQHVARYYFKKKDYEKAAAYSKKYYYGIKKEKLDPASIGEVIKILVYVEPDRAFRLFVRYLSRMWSVNSPGEKMDYCEGVCYMLKYLLIKKEKETLKLDFPKDFPIYQESASYKITDLYEYFHGQLKKIGALLDESNGNHIWNRMLNELDEAVFP